MRVIRFTAPALLAAALAGCVDEPVSSIPPGQARVVFASEFSFSGMAAGLPIEAVRLTPTFHPEGGAAGEPRRVTVDSNDDEFAVEAFVDLGDADSADVVILIELLSTAAGQDIVEWSAEIGPIEVVADETVEEHSAVELVRGPIENRGVLSIDAVGPPSMMAGSSHPAFAITETDGAEPTVIWSSSNAAIIEVEPVVGDSVDLFAHGEGSAWIFAGAGAHVDSFIVTVSDVETGPIAGVMVFPDSAVMAPGTSRTLSAFAFDANEFPVTATFTWATLDGEIATVSSTGVVTAHAIGFTQIVATSGAFSDTIDIDVQPLPEGVDVMFVGGTAGAEFDWFTADNWTPARVPTATDVVYIPTGTFLVELDGNTEIGGFIADSLGGYSLDINASTLTIHGDLIAPFIFGDLGARIIMDAPGSVLSTSSIPALTVLADVTVDEQAFVNGDLEIQGARFELGSTGDVVVIGDLRVVDGSIGLAENDTTFTSAYLYVQGDALFDGGDNTSSISGGSLAITGDFTVTPTTCTAFAPIGGDVELASDSLVISIGCSGANGNRFNDLYIYQGETSGTQHVELQSDVHVAGAVDIYGGDGTVVSGNGHTFRARYGWAQNATFDHAFIEVVSVSASDHFSTDSVIITGMAGQTRPQVLFSHPGMQCGTGCYGPIDVRFDPTSDGPYIEVVDHVQNGDSVIVYMNHNPGDGPSRTVTSGEAAVHWAGVPLYLLYWSGSGQIGTQHQPLPDSLVARVVDYAFVGVDGVPVDWTVVQGDGSVAPAVTTTDAEGYAWTVYTVGDTINAHEVIATSVVLPADTAFYFATPTATSPMGVSAQRPATYDVLVPPAMPVPAERPRIERRARPVPPSRPATLDIRSEPR